MFGEMNARRTYQRRRGRPLRHLAVYLEPGLLVRLRGLAQYRGMTCSAIGAQLIAQGMQDAPT
jgi:hypothetical protein